MATFWATDNSSQDLAQSLHVGDGASWDESFFDPFEAPSGEMDMLQSVLGPPVQDASNVSMGVGPPTPAPHSQSADRWQGHPLPAMPALVPSPSSGEVTPRCGAPNAGAHGAGAHGAGAHGAGAHGLQGRSLPPGTLPDVPSTQLANMHIAPSQEQVTQPGGGHDAGAQELETVEQSAGAGGSSTQTAAKEKNEPSGIYLEWLQESQGMTRNEAGALKVQKWMSKSDLKHLALMEERIAARILSIHPGRMPHIICPDCGHHTPLPYSWIESNHSSTFTLKLVKKNSNRDRRCNDCQAPGGGQAAGAEQGSPAAGMEVNAAASAGLPSPVQGQASYQQAPQHHRHQQQQQQPHSPAGSMEGSHGRPGNADRSAGGDAHGQDGSQAHGSRQATRGGPGQPPAASGSRGAPAAALGAPDTPDAGGGRKRRHIDDGADQEPTLPSVQGQQVLPSVCHSVLHMLNMQLQGQGTPAAGGQDRLHSLLRLAIAEGEMAAGAVARLVGYLADLQQVLAAEFNARLIASVACILVYVDRPVTDRMRQRAAEVLADHLGLRVDTLEDSKVPAHTFEQQPEALGGPKPQAERQRAADNVARSPSLTADIMEGGDVHSHTGGQQPETLRGPRPQAVAAIRGEGVLTILASGLAALPAASSLGPQQHELTVRILLLEGYGTVAMRLPMAPCRNGLWAGTVQLPPGCAGFRYVQLEAGRWFGDPLVTFSLSEVQQVMTGRGAEACEALKGAARAMQEAGILPEQLREGKAGDASVNLSGASAIQPADAMMKEQVAATNKSLPKHEPARLPHSHPSLPALEPADGSSNLLGSRQEVTGPVDAPRVGRLGVEVHSQRYKEIEEGSLDVPVIKDIGSGNFGVVKLMRDNTDGELVAVKFIERGEKVDKYIEREVINHSSLLHPNIIRFKEIFLTPTHLGIVMEYAAGGDLFERVKTSRLSEDEARLVFQQLISAVSCCHSKGVCHRDLKLRNTLLDGQPAPRLKICDFGYSKSAEFDSQPKSSVGTPAYAAPEVLARKRYNGESADVWSCGVTLYVMLVGAYPFEDPADPGNVRKMFKRVMDVRYSWPSNLQLTQECMDVVNKIFVSGPEQRIDIAGIQSHPWFTKNLPNELKDGGKAAQKVLQPSPQSMDELKMILAEARKEGTAPTNAYGKPQHFSEED